MRCVTLDGDIYEPSGTLTGGSRKRDNFVIDKQFEYKDMQNKYNKCLDQVTTLDEYFMIKLNAQKEFAILNNKLDLKNHELLLLRKKLESSPYYQIKTSFVNLENEIGI